MNVSTPERFIREAFWMILGREISPLELRDELRLFRPDDPAVLTARLLSSPEFRLLYLGWKDRRGSGRDPAIREPALQALGSNEEFATRAYEFLLGRPPDEGGLRYFIAGLEDGALRGSMLRGLVLSDEFTDRYGQVTPDGGFLIRDTQLCELANPAKWDNPDWLKFLYDLQILPDHKLSMHRKSYEFVQLLYGLDRLGRLRDDVSVLSVGAGHECVLYWLANHVGAVVATDLYEGRWQSDGAQEGDDAVVRHPETYAPFPYRRDRLVFLQMNGTQLAFRGEMFDAAYSLSSIEHFGGVAGAAAALGEMTRVLKPGGLLVVATEYALSGPPRAEVFQPHEIHALLDRPGLRLLHPVDDDVYQRYEYRPVDLEANPHQTPHMVVRLGDTVFTSVIAFLEKT